MFSPEQCLAMLLTKLKDVSSTALQTPINDCVISVPSYFTNSERKALLDSAAIAGKWVFMVGMVLFKCLVFYFLKVSPF